MSEYTNETFEGNTNLTEDASMEDFAENTDFAGDEMQSADEGAQEEGDDNSAEGSETEQGGEEQESTEELFTLKHLQTEHKVGKDEVITLAQKGMQYDHVYQEAQQLKDKYKGADPLLQMIDEIAKENNMSREQYIEFVKQERTNYEINHYMDRGMPEAEARQLVAQNNTTREQARLLNELQAQKAQELQAQNYTSAMVARFAHEYPGVTELPEEVIAQVRAGADMTLAYKNYEIAQLRAANGQAEVQGQQKALAGLKATKKAGTGALSGGQSKELDFKTMSDKDFSKFLAQLE